MSTPFSRTLRSLEVGGAVGVRTVGVLLALASLWIAWAFFGSIPVFATATRARFEAPETIRQIATPVAGLVTRVDVGLGQSVTKQQVLLTIDDAELVIRAEQSAAKIDNLLRRIEAISARISAVGESTSAKRMTLQARMRQAAESRSEAEHLAQIESERAERLRRLGESGLIPPSEVVEAASRANAQRARVRSLDATAHAIKSELAQVPSDAEELILSLEGDRRELENELADEQAALSQSRLLIERMRVRSPVDGHIGSIAGIRAGAWAAGGTVVASIIPSQPLQVSAWFDVAEMPRLRPSQRAWVWIDSPQHRGRSRLGATVRALERDPSGNEFRVLLRVDPRRIAAAGIEPGIPATVTVEVERLAPLRALLRAAGMDALRPQ